MHFPPNVRLACQTRVIGDSVKLRRIIQDESDIGLYVGTVAGHSTQQLGEEREMMYLNCKTYFSFRYGTFATEELVKTAADLGITALGLTNINSTCHFGFCSILPATKYKTHYRSG